RSDDIDRLLEKPLVQWAPFWVRRAWAYCSGLRASASNLRVPSAPCSRSATTPSRNAAAAAVQTEASVGAFTPSAPVIASAKLSSNAASANAHQWSLQPTTSPHAT